MKLKRYLWSAILLIAIASAFLAYSQQVFQPHQGVQVSTLGALNMEMYEGAATSARLKQQGNFGLRTFEGLEGEMVGLDGKFYLVKTDGVAYPITDKVKTPFYVVTFFPIVDALRSREFAPSLYS